MGGLSECGHCFRLEMCCKRDRVVMFSCFEVVFSLFHLKRTPQKWQLIHQTPVFKEMVLKGLVLDSVVIKPLGSQRNFPQSAVGMYQALDYFVLKAEQGEYFCRSLIKVNAWAFCASK